MSGIIVIFLISDGRILSLEEYLVWPKWFPGCLGIRDVVNQTSSGDSA